jgi:hypothetical protein
MADTQKLFSSIEAKYRLPSGYLARVYQLESRGGKDNYNASTKAAGPFQFVPRTAKGMGLDDPYDLEASADATARLAVQNRTYLQRRGIEDPDGKTLYLAHQQGAAGAEKLLKGGDAPATSALGEVYKDPKIAAKAVTGNGGQADMPSSAFANKIMAKYEGKDTTSDPLRPYSALGETPHIDKTSQASHLAAPDTADVLEETAPSEDTGSSKKQSYALNALLSASNSLQQQQQAPMLAIPRLSYAGGGIVDLVKKAKNPAPVNVPETTARVLNEISIFSQEGNLDAEKIAFLLRMAATDTIPPDKAAEFAAEIMAKDTAAIMRRVERYPRALRMLARLDLALGGLEGQGYGLVANQHRRFLPQPTKRMGYDPKTAKPFAKGGIVERRPKSPVAFQELAQHSIARYGLQIGNNLVRRSESDPDKLFFALNQYAKNVVGPKSPFYAKELKYLSTIAKKFKLSPKKEFNRTEDALDTEAQLDGYIKSVPKQDAAFRDALLRMKAMVGWKPKVRSKNGRQP